MNIKSSFLAAILVLGTSVSECRYNITYDQKEDIMFLSMAAGFLAGGIIGNKLDMCDDSKVMCILASGLASLCASSFTVEELMKRKTAREHLEIAYSDYRHILTSSLISTPLNDDYLEVAAQGWANWSEAVFSIDNGIELLNKFLVLIDHHVTSLTSVSDDEDCYREVLFAIAEAKMLKKDIEDKLKYLELAKLS